MARGQLKRIDLTGKRFGRLIALKCFTNKECRTFWLCRCNCGNEVKVYSQHLKRGLTKSCGCYHKEQTSKAKKTHGMSDSKIYFIWQSMRRRCNDNNSRNFKNYGGRGIKVCKRWNKFENFMSDMGLQPSKSHSIDRIDNDGPYSKENCRWVTIDIQSGNKRSSILLTYNGETHCLTKWSRIVGISRGGLIARLKRGWSIEKSFTYPIRGNNA